MLLSEPDPNLTKQYPDIATVPLAHDLRDTSWTDIAVCFVNPSPWEVILPKNKTVQTLHPVDTNMSINKVSLEESFEQPRNCPRRNRLHSLTL